MRSIKRRFEAMEKKYPDTSDYINFARAVKHQKFSKNMLRRWFNILVEKNSYSKGDRKYIISHLRYMTDMPEDDQNKTRNVSQTMFINQQASIAVSN